MTFAWAEHWPGCQRNVVVQRSGRDILGTGGSPPPGPDEDATRREHGHVEPKLSQFRGHYDLSAQEKKQIDELISGLHRVML